MTTIIYSPIALGTTENINYVDGVSNVYPDSNAISIFGPLHVPRIYGKDLTAFEVASSGKIAITLNDIHSMDISRSNLRTATEYISLINSKSNYALKLSTSNDLVYTLYDSYSNDMYVQAESNIYLNASNNLIMQTQTNLNMVANNGDLFMYANNSNMSITMDASDSNFSIYSSSDVTVLSSNNTFISSSNNILLKTLSNSGISSIAGDLSLNANASNMYINFDASDSNLTLYSSKDVTILSSNNTIVSSSNNFSLISLNNVSLSSIVGDFSLNANANNMFVNMDASDSNLAIFSSKDVTISSSNNTNISSSNNFSLTTLSNVGVSSLAGDLSINANASNMYVTLDASESNITIFSSKDVIVNTSNTFNVSACNDIILTANDTITLDAAVLNFNTQSDFEFRAQSNINFYIDAASDPNEFIFNVSRDSVRINGNLILTGEINTSNVNTTSTTVIQETLKVSDKEIRLANVGDATSNDFLPVDGIANSGAGIWIDGFPSGTDSNTPATLISSYDKSFTWNHRGDDVNKLGSSNRDTEPIWKLEGGAFNITVNKNYGNNLAPDVKELAFTFRINEREELELIKKYYNNSTSNYLTRVISKFGRIL